MYISIFIRWIYKKLLCSFESSITFSKDQMGKSEEMILQALVVSANETVQADAATETTSDIMDSTGSVIKANTSIETNTINL